MNTSVTIEQLKCFVAVSKELNFRKAAKMLNMSQPPVTRHIVNLEYNLKTKLFERNSRSVKLTKDGTLFLTHATDIISRIEDASKIIDKVSIKTEKLEPSKSKSVKFEFDRKKSLICTLISSKSKLVN